MTVTSDSCLYPYHISFSSAIDIKFSRRKIGGNERKQLGLPPLRPPPEKGRSAFKVYRDADFTQSAKFETVRAKSY